ncbi:stage III sporulation protein AG [Salimicrobium halophilum]|uniref:Stage III sporulation protein AG n=1 Tax=Salimicrobium halophilum TaxID=86666 RepID=A0A1G8PUJ9_9BACI|nr:stage III sporulation protein AG [Salimicrobium halophilum]SDI96137.1 stage III sporulation protein AG [Salimicrobium halophilum]
MKWEKWRDKVEEWTSVLNRPKYLLLIGGVGVLLLLIGNALSLSGDEEETAEEKIHRKEGALDKIKAYETYYEEELKTILESISFVSDVQVMVNVDATEKMIYEMNESTQTQVTKETDEDKQRRVEDEAVDKELAVINESGESGPVATTTKKPNVSGVSVTASGVENIKVKEWVVEAVTRALDVPSHRVSVIPK